jgi:hypothetical protein
MIALLSFFSLSSSVLQFGKLTFDVIFQSKKSTKNCDTNLLAIFSGK